MSEVVRLGLIIKNTELFFIPFLGSELLEFPEKSNRSVFCHANEVTFWKASKDEGRLPGGTK